MTTCRSAVRLRLMIMACLLSAWTMQDASAATPKRVLILDPFGRDVTPYSAAAEAIQTTLLRELGEPVDLYQMSLELAWSSAAEEDEKLVASLESRLRNHQLDLVIPVGAPSVRLVARHRERLFPGVPLVFVAADPRTVPASASSTVVTQTVNLKRMVEDILLLQPSTTNIAVVFGGTPIEKFWENECRREFKAFSNRVSFTWLTNLPFQRLLERASALPPRSFVLFGLHIADSTRVPFEHSEALRRLRSVANAPIYGYFESEFGLGPIGGRLYQEREIGVSGARVAIRILRGERPESIPPLLLPEGPPVYDWRELQRWGIPESRLPAGSTIRFRRQGLWEQYRWQLVGAALFMITQTVLIVGLMVNLRRRRRAEHAIAASEELNRATFEQAAVGIAHVGTDGRWLRVNDKLCAIVGYTREELLKLTFQDITHPDDLAKDLLQVSQVLSGDLRTYSMEKRYFRRDGSVVWVLLTVSLLRTAAGEPRHFISVVEDISERKRAEEALRTSEARLHLAAESAGAGHWSYDPATGVIWATQRARALFGFSADETVTVDRLLKVSHPEDRARVREVLLDLPTFDQAADLEIRVVLPNGNERWTTSRGRYTKGASGEPSVLMGVSMDITDRKSAEEVRRSFGSRLIRAQEEERSRVARELHDDITQRLALLAVDAADIELGTDAGPQAGTIGSVRQGLQELCDDVRALSHRIHPSSLEVVGLAAALKAECDRFSRAESLRTEVAVHDIPTHLPPDVALCLLRIAQESLRNVTRHAKASVVQLSLRPLDGGVQLEVRDDGIGFNPELARSRPTLGLQSMRERLLLVHGKLHVASAPGLGTSIIAWAPLIPPAA